MLWPSRESFTLSLGLPQSHKLLEPNVPANFHMHWDSYQTDSGLSASEHRNRPFMHWKVVSHILLATRLMVLRYWKSALAHNLSNVERMVDHNHAFACILMMNGMRHEAIEYLEEIFSQPVQSIIAFDYCIKMYCYLLYVLLTFCLCVNPL